MISAYRREKRTRRRMGTKRKEDEKGTMGDTVDYFSFCRDGASGADSVKLKILNHLTR